MASGRPAARPWRFGARARVGWAPAAVAVGGCAGAPPPDPRPVVEEWAAATERGDAVRTEALLSRAARRTLGSSGVRRALDENRQELRDRARALRGPGARVERRVTVRFEGGRTVEIEQDQEGRLRLDEAPLLPVDGRRPEQVIEALREALATRSFARLLQLLTRERREDLAADLASLEDALGDAESHEVRVEGDVARVELGGGHFVVLRRQDGLWRVEDFQ